MFRRHDEIERRSQNRLALLLLSGVATAVGLGFGCELYTLDRAKLYEQAFDAAGIDITPKPDAAGAADQDAAADAEADAALDAQQDAPLLDAGDAAVSDVGTDAVVDAGTDTGTGTDAADAAGE